MNASKNPSASPKSACAARRFMPKVAELEDRSTPATFYVDPTFTGPTGSTATFNGTGPTVTIGTDGFATLNAAFNATAAAAGQDTIVLSSATHQLNNSGGTVVLGANNPVSIIGQGQSASTIVPTNNTASGVVSVLTANAAGAVLNLSSLTFDGQSGATPAIRTGRTITYDNGATGTINQVTVQNVIFPNADGYAISARNGSNITVTNSTLQNYGRVGISISQSTAFIQSNTITGQGTTNRVNYGIQADAGSTATINANTITGNTGQTSDNAGNILSSANIFAFTSGNTTPTLQIFGNSIQGGQTGVLVDSNADSGVNASSVLVYANNFSGNVLTDIAADTASAGAVPAPSNFYAGGTKTSGFVRITNPLGSAAPVVTAATPQEYSLKTGIPLDSSVTTFGVSAGGGSPRVQIYGADGKQLSTVSTGVSSSFTGGLRVALADVNGDGVTDTVVGTGPGITAGFTVVSGKDNTTVLASVSPFGTFTGGVFVAAADLNGDGKAEVVVTPDQGGGPRVVVYTGASLAPNVAPVVLANFGGIADLNGAGDLTFRGGARPALGDVTGDGIPDLVISAGFTGGPRINIWSGAGIAAANGGAPTINPLANFFAFEQTLRNGAFVGAADINGDGLADPVFGGGPGGAPRVRVADAAQVLALKQFSLDDPANAKVTIANFFAGDQSNRGGVRVLGRDLDADGIDDIITGSGDNSASNVFIYPGSSVVANPGSPTASSTINPFNSVLANGVFVG